MIEKSFYKILDSYNLNNEVFVVVEQYSKESAHYCKARVLIYSIDLFNEIGIDKVNTKKSLALFLIQPNGEYIFNLKECHKHSAIAQALSDIAVELYGIKYYG